MARECQDASRNLNVATKEANGGSDSNQGRAVLEPHLSGAASGGLSRESPPSDDGFQELPGVSFSGEEATTAASSSTTEPLARLEGVLGSSKTSPPPSSSSSDSETKDMEGDPSMLGCICRPKGKQVSESLVPERPVSAKRRLWDVNHEEVEESLKREIKRMRQEEAFVKSSKWNFDFEREVPLRGSWKWRKGEAPGFYRSKEYSSAKKLPSRRFFPYERPATSRSLPSEVAHLSSTLVTAAAASSCSNATPTQPSATESSAPIPGPKTSAEDLPGGTPYSVQDGPLLKVPPATTTCLSATFSRPIDIIITTTPPSVTLQPTPRATYVASPSISRSRSNESSQENSNSRRGGTSETSAVSSSRFYPPSRPPDDRRGGTAPSSSSATNRTCQSPNKKKMKASQSGSGNGSSDSGGTSSSPSHLLKYYR